MNTLRRVFGAEAIANVHGQGYAWRLAPDVAPAERLFGRDAQVAELGARLGAPATRVLALVGIGGVGKTRTAIAVCATCSAGAWRC